MEKKPNGRPTKWAPEINDMIVEFFSAEPNREVERVNRKTGAAYSELVPNPLPHLSAFAREIGVSHDTLCEWAKEENREKYPGFSEAYKKAKQLQKEFLIENGLNGLYNPAFAIFTAKNITDMRDRQEHELSGKDGGPVSILGIEYSKPKP